jgi:hypothetical protein
MTGARCIENRHGRGGRCDMNVPYCQQVEWVDNFDIATDNITEVKSSAPTLSPQRPRTTSQRCHHRYQSIVQAGGWGTVTQGRQGAAHRHEGPARGVSCAAA